MSVKFRRSKLEKLERRNLLTSFVLGDVTGDGNFDSGDLMAVFSHGEYEDDVACNSTLREGDWNGDCEFDTRDLEYVFREGSYQPVVHPRLFFDPDDVPQLQEKVKNAKFSRLFQAELRFARRSLDENYADPTRLERLKAMDANRMAFVVLMLDQNDPDRPAIAAKVRDILSHINDGLWDATVNEIHHADWNGGDELHKWYAGSALADYSAAYDWLVGAGELSGVAQTAVRFRILRIAQIEHEIQSTRRDQLDRSIYFPRMSNYGFRSFSGVGIVALTFPDQQGLIEDPEGLLNPSAVRAFDTRETLAWVMHELFEEMTTEEPWNQTTDSYIEHYVSPDGFNEEGYTYQNDVFGMVSPFLVAYDNTLGIDFISDQGEFDGRIAQMYLNNVRVMLPDQTHPVIGDSYEGDYLVYHELIADYTKQPDTSHWFIENVSRLRTPRLGFSMPSFRESVAPLPTPTYRTEFQEEAGVAVFRDTWGPDATYLMLMAQNRPVRGHNQADQGSFFLYANGTYLVVDPGYGAAYARDPDARGYILGGKWNWITSALGHSGVTVDSVYTVEEAPREQLMKAIHPRMDIHSFTVDPDPGYLRQTLAARDVDYAMAEVIYEEKAATLQRGIAFPRHRYFVFEDQLEASDVHQYGWQLHLGDSATGTMTHSDDRYHWTTQNPRGEDVSLEILMLAGNRNVNIYDNGPTNVTGYDFSTVYDHTYILADEHAEDTRYVTLLNPHATSDGPMEVDTLLDGRVWKITHSPDEYDLIVSQSTNDQISVDGITTDAQFLVASIDRIDGTWRLRSVLARNGTQAKADYEEQIEWQIPADRLLHYESDFRPPGKPFRRTRTTLRGEP